MDLSPRLCKGTIAKLAKEIDDLKLAAAISAATSQGSSSELKAARESLAQTQQSLKAANDSLAQTEARLEEQQAAFETLKAEAQTLVEERQASLLLFRVTSDSLKAMI